MTLIKYHGAPLGRRSRGATLRGTRPQDRSERTQSRATTKTVVPFEITGRWCTLSCR